MEAADAETTKLIPPEIIGVGEVLVSVDTEVLQ